MWISCQISRFPVGGKRRPMGNEKPCIVVYMIISDVTVLVFLIVGDVTVLFFMIKVFLVIF